MADINVERKKRSILPLLLGLLAAALLLWLLFSLLNRDDDDDVAPVPADTTAAAAPIDTFAMGAAAGAATLPADSLGAAGAAAGGALPVAQIVGGPQQYAGQTVSGTARVAEVVSDHGFWVEENGERLFVALGEPQSGGQRVQVRNGQTVQLSGTVHGRDDVPAGIDPEARGIAEGQNAFLYAPASQVQVQGGA